MKSSITKTLFAILEMYIQQEQCFRAFVPQRDEVTIAYTIPD